MTNQLPSIVRAAMLVTATPFLIAANQGDAVQQEALEKANLAKAIYCMEVIEVNLDVDTFGEECVAEGYIQHSQHVPDGKDGLLEYFRSRIDRQPQLHGEVKRAGADGDLVWLHMHVKPEPESLGTAVIHIFRMENGLFVEHWGVGQRVPETSVHDNPMF